MAKARMVHKTISTSLQVNRISLPARLLYTWMIPHADDEGRMKGDPAYIKATVVPMTKWSFKKIQLYLNEMKNIGLVHYWDENSEWYIEFIKWTDYQQIRKDRFIPSKLPSNTIFSGNHLATKRQQLVDQEAPQANISESNRKELNKSEYNLVADIKTFKEEYIDPTKFKPTTASEVAALEAFNKLEPNNTKAFSTTYLSASRKGLPAHQFYTFTSEIKQDETIKNPGAVFHKKVEDFISTQV